MRNVLPARRKDFLILSVTNESDISTENVVVEIGEEEESDNLYFERSLILGTIDPRMTISKEMAFFLWKKCGIARNLPDGAVS